MRRCSIVVAFVCLLAVGTLTLSGQETPAGVRVAFEVASVKPSDPSSPGQAIQLEPGGRLNVRNMPVRTLITFAYQLQPSQLVGGPAWLERDRFDIVAKLEGEARPAAAGGPDRAMLAMRTLLGERFKLAIHPETRDLDVFALMVVKPGQLGPALKPAEQDCSPEGMAARRAAPPDPSKPFFCGLRGMGPGKLALSGMPLSFYARTLAAQVGRFVVDRTGLEGRWDFTLTFLPQGPPGQPFGAAAPGEPADPDAPDLLSALRQQLGLKLEPMKAPVDVMVIDGVEKPAAD